MVSLLPDTLLISCLCSRPLEELIAMDVVWEDQLRDRVTDDDAGGQSRGALESGGHVLVSCGRVQGSCVRYSGGWSWLASPIR
jgi:hypothetical protein